MTRIIFPLQIKTCDVVLRKMGRNTSENQKYGKMTPIVSEWLDFFFLDSLLCTKSLF
jgi:hypothetical protein